VSHAVCREPRARRCTVLGCARLVVIAAAVASVPGLCAEACAVGGPQRHESAS
jgi:hypothetical protein